MDAYPKRGEGMFPAHDEGDDEQLQPGPVKPIASYNANNQEESDGILTIAGASAGGKAATKVIIVGNIDHCNEHIF